VTPVEETPPAASGTYNCSTGNLGGLVGRERSTAVGNEALRLANARTIRWIRPGDAVTMDFMPDRLNVDLDNSGRITNFRCG